MPFLTLLDPVTSGEGALDPLGLATTGDRLANWILPGLAARMSRPRFLTAMAVAAVVCDEIDDIAVDRVTPAHIVFEWLLVEGFTRRADDKRIRGTPGIDKARRARDARLPMCAKSYLKTPSVFGFHGAYKRLALDTGILDEDFHLCDNGYTLVKIWEAEQKIEGFLDSSLSRNSSGNVKQVLRSAVRDGLKCEHTNRSAAWSGWSFFADHLAPSEIGEREAGFIRDLILDAKGDRRGEIFKLIEQPDNLKVADKESEAALVRHIIPQSSPELARRLETIKAYEEFCALMEDAFDWLRYLSSQAGAWALSRAEFADKQEIRIIASELPRRLEIARQFLNDAPVQIDREFDQIAVFFEGVESAAELYDALIDRHAQVQKAKQPEGKREWFERAMDGSAFVRIPYRLDESPVKREWWNRPYRLMAVRSFCRDFVGRKA
ncbi:MAG: hypothetical protein L0229_10930 [Blastocatellia bacterium]|nr:hypothetical protein [Blastocatellia bacterium]